MISQFLDVILPGDASLGAPPASKLNIQDSFKQQKLEQQMEELITFLESLSLVKFNMTLTELETEQYLLCVELAKRKKVRLVSHLILHCLKVYYTHPQVLSSLSAGSIPPFPNGNSIENDDWSILEDVFERGPIFRDVL